MIVVGPNLAFLSYIRNVLPALGELDVTQTTVADLVASRPVRGTDTDEAAAVKGDARMAEVLRRALWAPIRPPARGAGAAAAARAGCGCPRTRSRSWPQELRDRGVRYGTGRELLGAPDRARDPATSSRRPARPATTAPTTRSGAPRRYASASTRCGRRSIRSGWSSALLSDRRRTRHDTRTRLAVGRRIAAPSSGRSRRAASARARWSRADQVLIDEAADLIERTPVDRARGGGRGAGPVADGGAGDRAAVRDRGGDRARRHRAGHHALGGDLLARRCSAHLGKPDAAVRELDVGYRVPRQILDYASRLLPSIAPGLRPARSLRADPDRWPSVAVPTRASSAARVARAARRALERPGSVAVICADAQAHGGRRRRCGAAGLGFDVLGAASRRVRAMRRLTIVPVTWPRALSSTTWCSVEPAGSRPGRPMACGGSTWRSPARYRG